MLSRFLAALALVLFITPSWAAPGDLDTSFGGGAGWVSTAITRPDGDLARSMVQQADGKLVVAGSSVNGGANWDFALVRYNNDGSLDTTFNGAGKLTTSMGAASDTAQSVIQQTDGKLVVAGYGNNDGSSNNDFVLVRYNSDGALDTTFNGSGKLTTGFGVTDDRGYSVTQQTDGKLVVAGTGNNDFALVRYNSNGTLDTTFNGTGKLTTAIGASGDGANSVIQQADGKLVVAGSSNNGSNTDFALVRYNGDGSLDTTFNGTGKLTTAIGASSFDRAYSVIQQADGKLVVAGDSSNGSAGSNKDFALVRYNSDGALDTTFDTDGKLTTAIGASNDTAESVIQQADGKLVVAGYSSSGSDDFALVRYNSDGTLDTTFNGTGKLTTAIGASSDDEAYSVIQRADGKLVVAGSSSYDFALVRYNSDGTLDTTFDTDGKLLTNVAETSQMQARSVIQQADGKLVVAGSNRNGDANYDFALVRYNGDGTLDATFNGTGKLTTDYQASDDYAQSVIQQADGKLVVAGYCENSSIGYYDFTLVRYNSDGTLDTGFNGTGRLITGIGVSIDRAYSVIQQADGKLVVAGYSVSLGNYDFALVRYNGDGTLDTTFSGDGKLTTAIGASNDYAYSVIQQADGKLVVAGYSRNGSGNDDFALVRYNGDGTLDTTFNGTGKLTTAIGASNDIAYSVIQQADGKLVVAGTSNYDFALVRYNSDGTLDTTFNGTGKLTTAIGIPDDQVPSVIQQADGKLVVAGYNGDGYNNFDFAVERYNGDGTLDTTFNGTGKRTVAFSVLNDKATSMIQQADGKLVTARDSNGMPTGQEFVVARFESGQPDTDNDGYVDGLDADDDNDGVADASDAFPLDSTESVDTDGDGIGNNADLDDDNDGIADTSDAFPLDPTNSGLDTDRDGLSDTEEAALGNNPQDNLDPPLMAISANYIVGIDNAAASNTAATVTSWNGTDGTPFSIDPCEFCISPVIAITASAASDLCAVNATDVACIWWNMNGSVDETKMLPMQFGGDTYSPLHDWDGYLKFLDASSTLRSFATHAVKISGDHATHVCTVSTTQGVYCWAQDSTADVVSSTVPASLQRVSTVSDVTVGAHHACAINGTAVQCWGNNDNGKTMVPAVVNTPKQLAAGADHTCAINTNGSISCWGDNSAGQLGDGNADGYVDGISNALRIAAGTNHTCAVTGSYGTPSTLRVSCWGSNSVGQIAVAAGLTNGSEQPVTVTAAGNQTCATRAGQAAASTAMVCWPVGLLP